MTISRRCFRGLNEKRAEVQKTRSEAGAKRRRRHKANEMTTTTRAPESNEIGSFNNPHRFVRTTKSILRSPPDLVQLRSSDLHHVLVNRTIVVQSPNLMRRIEVRSGGPVLAGVLDGVLILPIPYGVLLKALTFLHYRSTKPADVVVEKVICAEKHRSDVRTIEDWIRFKYDRKAGAKVLFELGENAFVYHLDMGQLDSLLEAALVLEVQPLVDLIRKRISSIKQYSKAIIRTILGQRIPAWADYVDRKI